MEGKMVDHALAGVGTVEELEVAGGTKLITLMVMANVPTVMFFVPMDDVTKKKIRIFCVQHNKLSDIDFTKAAFLGSFTLATQAPILAAGGQQRMGLAPVYVFYTEEACGSTIQA